jgi:hypothetical protein
MLRNYKVAAVGLLMLLGAAGCADLEVENLNAPDRARALKTATDMESLVGGAYVQWWYGQACDGATACGGGAGTPAFMLSNMSFQHSAWPANFGQVEYSWLPRKALVNAEADQYYGNLTFAWRQNYKAIYAAAEGLRAFANDKDLEKSLGDANRVRRVQAFGKFMLGLAHASLAVLYDSAFVVDEKTQLYDAGGQPLPPPAPKGYNDVMKAALGYFDEAIILANQGMTNVDKNWMSRSANAAQFIALTHSLKARFRAAVARTPAERQAVNWQAVLADLDKGLTSDWTMDLNVGVAYPWTSDPIDYWSYGGWQQLSYMILGMADQSGMYQKWLAKPVSARSHTIDGERFLIVTPDTRFPRGSTLAEQSEEENRGSLYVIPDPDIDEVDVSENWGQPGRGTWRWGWYFMTEPLSHQGTTKWPEVPVVEMDLLRAEALYRQGGHAAEVAAIINKTRVAAGLNATDAAGTNTSCVPKLPNGSCGDLWEMLKWEKRIEGQFKGLYASPWYFDGRGWGELYRGTPLQFPMPCKERNILGTSCYTFGGVGGNQSSAPTSVYNWPHEG